MANTFLTSPWSSFSSDSDHKMAHSDWSSWPPRSCASAYTNMSDPVFHELDLYSNPAYIPVQEQPIQYPFAPTPSFQTFQPQTNNSYPTYDTTFQVSDTRHHQYSQPTDNYQFHVHADSANDLQKRERVMQALNAHNQLPAPQQPQYNPASYLPAAITDDTPSSTRTGRSDRRSTPYKMDVRPGSASSLRASPTPSVSSTTTLHNPPSAPTTTPVTAPLRPHACHVCGALFQRGHDLSRHIKSHQNPKHSCPHCGKTYTRSDSVRRHVLRVKCGVDSDDP